MAIVEKMTEELFIKRFKEVRTSQFSDAALSEIFNYYNDLEENLEFDPVAICCEWTEYSYGDLKNEYGWIMDSEEFEDIDFIDELRDRTVLLERAGIFIIMDF
ncbi:MAG TPA: hypothetical protein HA306_06550 [Methanosarcina sp.]|nr:hypothetical protein [Methanosarcina sp.]